MSTVVWLPEQSHHRAEFGPFWGKPEQEDGSQGVQCIKTQAPCLSFSKCNVLLAPSSNAAVTAADVAANWMLRR